MTIMEFIHLIRRNIVIFSLILLACLASGYYAQNTFSAIKYENSIFLIFGVKDNFKGGDPYENLQAADQITESIQGWIKDPSFQKEVINTTGLNLSIKAKKQEKNNLLITFNSRDLSENILYKEAIVSLLTQKISNYNDNSDLQINLASQTFNYTENRYLPALIFILSIICGLFLGILFSYFYEKFSGKLISIKEVTGYFEKIRPFYFTDEREFKTGQSFLLKHLGSVSNDNRIQILHFSSPSKTLKNILSSQNNFKEIFELSIPDDLNSVRMEIPTVLVCQLGVTPSRGLDYLSELKFSRLEIVVFDRLKS